MIRKFIAATLLAFCSFAFAGGSSPGLYFGQVPTAGQWNSYFAAKLDFTPGTVNTIPYWDGNGNQLNALLSGDCTSVANVVTCSAIKPIVGTTASIGGAALLAGACATATTTVTGATTSMTVTTSPVTYPGDGADWQSYVSAANTVVTKVCAMIALTPTASVYNLRVIQ